MTEIPLRDYVDQRFAEAQRSVDLAREHVREVRDLVAHELIVMRETVSQRLEVLNEHKREMEKARRDFVARETYETHNASVERRLHAMEVAHASREGYATGVLWTAGVAATIISLIIGLVIKYGGGGS